MTAISFKYFPTILITLLLAVCSPLHAQGSTLSRIKEEIQDKKQYIEVQKQEILKLTQEERNMFGDLAKIEDHIAATENVLFKLESELEEIDRDEYKIKQDYQILEWELNKITSRLKLMLTRLWPVHSRKLENRLGSLDDWERADRNFVWLASLYEETKKELQKAHDKSAEIDENILIQQDLREKAEEKLNEVNESKDMLLEDKLSLLAGIRGIRAQKITREQEVKGLLETINKLNYKLKSLTSRNFVNFKGSLPRPCDGRTEIRFNLSSKPPARGIGIQTAGNVDVRSIFWGKVVHNDTLRGFGRVVIIYHGYNYYSLYAYLAESFVKTGQEVEKDETIGKTGYYPKLKETGLYFELRFHQKPVNPRKWLARK